MQRQVPACTNANLPQCERRLRISNADACNNRAVVSLRCQESSNPPQLTASSQDWLPMAYSLLHDTKNKRLPHMNYLPVPHSNYRLNEATCRASRGHIHPRVGYSKSSCASLSAGAQLSRSWTHSKISHLDLSTIASAAAEALSSPAVSAKKSVDDAIAKQAQPSQQQISSAACVEGSKDAEQIAGEVGVQGVDGSPLRKTPCVAWQLRDC